MSPEGHKVLSHQNLHTYITLQYSTLHLHCITSTLQYITVHYSTVHLQYITVHYIYIHAQDLVHKIVCHQRGISPKSSERTCIYIILTLTLHYIGHAFFTGTYIRSWLQLGAQNVCHQRGMKSQVIRTNILTFYNLQYIALHTVLYTLIEGQKWKITDFCEMFFFWRWAQVLIHHFFNDRGLRSNDGLSATGNTIWSTNGETKRETTEKWKVTYLYFYLFNCFKILSVYKSKEKMENHCRFLWNVFF